MLSNPKSAAKSVTDESHLEETPTKMVFKGKHTSGKRKVYSLILSFYILYLFP